MTRQQIKEMKDCIVEELVKNYRMSEDEAIKAINTSYFCDVIEEPNSLVNHDTIEEWARFIYEETGGNKDGCIEEV